MSKLKNATNFTIVPNDLLNSPDISLKAKGLWAFIKSKPDGWDFSANRIADQTRDGVDSVKSGLQELEAANYLRRAKAVNEYGQFEGYDYEISDLPFSQEGKTVDGKSTDGKTVDGKTTDKVIKKEQERSSKKEVVVDPPEKKEIGRSFDSSVLDYLLDQIPELTGYPGLRPIVESLEQREDYKPYIQFVRVHKKPKIFEITGWRKWFYEDYLSSQYTQKTKREEGTTWTDEEYILFMKRQGMEEYI